MTLLLGQEKFFGSLKPVVKIFSPAALLSTAFLFSQDFVCFLKFVLLILMLTDETINNYWNKSIEEAGK